MRFRFFHSIKIRSHTVVITLCLFFLGAVMVGGNEGNFRIITVKAGDSISYLSFKIYKKYDDNIVAQIKENNPEITDINTIFTGQRIRFPRLRLVLGEPQKTIDKIKKPVISGKKTEKPERKAIRVEDKLQTREAYLTYLKGQAKIRRFQTQKWKQIRKNARLGQGDKIRIGKDSKAEIITFDCDIIRLAANTELEISHLQKNPVKIIKKKSLFLSAGRMWNKAKSLFHSKSEYTVRTPNAISGIRGTAYNIDVSSEMTTRIKTYSGTVKVWHPESKKSVQPGWKLTKPAPVSGPPTVSMQEWKEILVKMNEELIITRQGASKKTFDPKLDEKHDDWIKWNKVRDKEFDSLKAWN